MLSNSTRGASVIHLHPSHYISDYWTQNADPYVSELPTMSPGIPIGWALVILLIGLTSKYIGPWCMKNRSPFNCKPWILCLNGCMYGWYTVGIVSVSVPSHWYTDCFKCAAYSATSSSIENLVIKHFAYSIVFVKLFDFLVFTSYKYLSKSTERMSDLYLFYLMIVCLGSVCLVKLQPGGIFIFCAIMDAITQIILYSYLTFAAASDYFKPSRRWKLSYFFSKMIAWSCILIHSAYFLAVDNCGDPLIKLCLVLFASLVLILFPYDFYRLDAIASQCKRSSSETTVPVKSRAPHHLNSAINNNNNMKCINGTNDDIAFMVKTKMRFNDSLSSAWPVFSSCKSLSNFSSPDSPIEWWWRARLLLHPLIPFSSEQ